MTWALTTVAVVLLAYATVSQRLQLLNVSGAMFFTTAGLLAGPVLGLLDLHLRGEQVKLLAEITLTLVLFAGGEGSARQPSRDPTPRRALAY
jgi:sodium/hydrogen antiporter